MALESSPIDRPATPPASRSRSSSTAFVCRLPLAGHLVLAAVFRLAVFACTAGPDMLMDRLELSTPLTGFRRCESTTEAILVRSCRAGEEGALQVELNVLSSDGVLVYVRQCARACSSSPSISTRITEDCSTTSVVQVCMLHSGSPAELTARSASGSQSPLHLLVFSTIIPPTSTILTSLAWTAADLVSAWALSRMWNARVCQNKEPSGDRQVWDGVVAFL